MERRNEIMEIKEVNKRLHELGFDSKREYLLYLKLKESMRQKIVIGIAS